MAARENLLLPRPVLTISRSAHAQNPALHAHRPTQLVLLDPGVLHRCTFAKYAVAFPSMSRSIVTRASSARRRLTSIRSALTSSLLTPRNWPAFSAFTQFARVCSTMPSALAAAATFCPEDTKRTASCLYSNVYRRRINFSMTISSLRLQQLAMRDVFRGQAHSSISCGIVLSGHTPYVVYLEEHTPG